MNIDCFGWDAARWQAEHDKYIIEHEYTDEARAAWLIYRDELYASYASIASYDSVEKACIETPLSL